MSPATETPVREPRIGDPGGGLDAPWQVIVLNDDHNTFDGVAHALAAVLPGVGFEQGMSFANRILPLARGAGVRVVLHVPPSGIWGYGGHGVYAAAAGKLRGEPPDPDAAFDRLVRVHLAAYGPATTQDIGQLAGLPA